MLSVYFLRRRAAPSPSPNQRFLRRSTIRLSHCFLHSAQIAPLSVHQYHSYGSPETSSPNFKQAAQSSSSFSSSRSSSSLPSSSTSSSQMKSSLARSFSKQLALLTALSILLSGVRGYTTELAAGDRECFTAFADKGEEVFGNFEVLTEGDYSPIEVTVTGPASKQVYHASDKSEETFSFEVEQEGEYELCIGNGANGKDDGIARMVGFSFRTDVLVDEDIANEESIRRLIELGNQLTKGLTNVLDHQSYMRQREDLHAATMESISSRVLIWTIVEALVLIGVAVWQVVYISKFFEVKRMI